MEVCQALPLLELLIYLTRENPDIDYLCAPIKRILRSENKQAQQVALFCVLTLVEITTGHLKID